MRYRLLVVTHGDAPHLEDAVHSFVEHVRLAPAELVCVADGPGKLPPLGPTGPPWRVVAHPRQLGFCAALLTGWQEARLPGADYVFWLENDFLLTRDLDLEAVARVLDSDPTLAQVALMRDAVNHEEKAAGGLYESRPGQYQKRDALVPSGGRMTAARWLQHRAYFTTNPSLMRRDFMAEVADGTALQTLDQHECEGKLGIDLVSRGYHFAAWGSGEPWCRHVGTRDGFGY